MSHSPGSLRVWPGIVIVLLQWIAFYVPGWIVPGTTAQFFAMLGGPAIGLLLLIVWWLLASRAPWKQRWGMLGILIGVFALCAALAHSTAGMPMYAVGLPLACSAFVFAAIVTREGVLRPRAVTFALAALVACVGWLFIRSDGVDGDMSQNYALRWSTPAEARVAPVAGTGRIVALPSPDDLAAASWPGFRGANRDAVVSGLRIETDWSTTPPEVIWRKKIGPGWSSFAVVGNCLYTQEQRGEQEIVSCYNPTNGEPVWHHVDEVRFYEAMAGPGPRATPTYHDGRLYSFGATGILNCLNAADGSLVWSRDAAVDTGAAVPDWGFSSSPLIVDGQVVVYTGASDGKAVVAYDAMSGEPRWFGPAGAFSYSSVQVATIEGRRQLLILSDTGATSLSPETGELLWDHGWPLDGMSRVVQPAVLEDGSVLIGTGFGLGLRRVQVANAAGGWTTEESWTSTAIKPYYNDFVVHRGHAYGFDGRILSAVALDGGERDWKGGRYGNGQLLLLADQDLLLVLSDRGEIALVRAEPLAFEELARMPVIDGKTWNHPALVDGVLYVRNGEEMAAVRLPIRGSTVQLF